MRTEEVGVLTGDLTVHTTWSGGEARISVQYSGASEWFTVAGSPAGCATERESRELHEAVVEAVRSDAAGVVPG